MPSYTEGAPKVILESLARYRPVIIFKEISHVKRDFKGIFICERNPIDFKKKVDYILKNYKQILKQIKRNKIPSKREFQNNLSRIIK